jgi:hypothetical protein
MEAVALCVPFERRDAAKAAGARWNAHGRVWTCAPELLASNAYPQLRPFVPRMYRPDVTPPYIRLWMVPQSAWGKNLRALLEPEQWDIVRRKAYADAGNRCRVCGGRGLKWPVEADEGWEYDEVTRLQTLKGVIALCPDCHGIRHWGKTMVDGGEAAAFERLMRINRWSRTEARAVVDTAFKDWERRSRLEWEIDCSWVTRVHGMTPSQAGAERAAHNHRDLVETASARSKQGVLRHLFEDAVPSRPATPEPEPSAPSSPVPAPSVMPKGIIRWLTATFRRPSRTTPARDPAASDAKAVDS